jgi:hypothetical protein
MGDAADNEKAHLVAGFSASFNGLELYETYQNFEQVAFLERCGT